MVPVCNADRITVDDNEHIAHKLDLAGKMEPALGIIGTDGSAASLCSALHGFGATIITGQTAAKKQLDSNPSSNTNIDQPFIQVSFLLISKPKKLARTDILELGKWKRKSPNLI